MVKSLLTRGFKIQVRQSTSLPVPTAVSTLLCREFFIAVSELLQDILEFARSKVIPGLHHPLNKLLLILRALLFFLILVHSHPRVLIWGSTIDDFTLSLGLRISLAFEDIVEQVPLGFSILLQTVAQLSLGFLHRPLEVKPPLDNRHHPLRRS
jgi:hypothetical protein